MSLASRQLRRPGVTGKGGSAALKQQFKMKGLSELQSSLNKLPDKLRDNALKNASAAGARVIRNEAKRLVKVDSGTLQDSIVVVRTFKQRGRRVKLKGAVVLGIKGVARYYAHLVEFGSSKQSPHPFMRPALDSKASEALKVIAEKLAKEIAKAAKKLSGWKPVKTIKRLTK